MIEFYVNYKTCKKPLNLENFDVEIGFGQGDFIVKKALENPEKTFFGFELSIVSLKNLYKRIKKHNLKNILYTKLDAVVGFQVLFKNNSIDNIYINYPDPFPKKRDEKRRITRIYALCTFAEKLKREGKIFLRTDDKNFFEYTLENLNQLSFFNYQYKTLNVENPITKYEKRWIEEGKTLYEIIITKVKELENENFYRFKEIRRNVGSY